MFDIIYSNSQDLIYGVGVYDSTSYSGTSSAQTYTIPSHNSVITVQGVTTFSSYKIYTNTSNNMDTNTSRNINFITGSGTTTDIYSWETHFCYSNSIVYVGDNEERKLKPSRELREELRLKKNALFRGTKLLESLLPKIEYDKFKETKALEVVTDNFLYKLKLGEKVKRISKDGKVERLCLVPKQRGLPDIDKLIGLKLLIEADEEYFNKTANVLNW